MSLSYAKIIRAGEASEQAAIKVPIQGEAKHLSRVVLRQEAEAHERAEALLKRAEEQAQKIISEAEIKSEALRAAAITDGRAAGLASLGAELLKLSEWEQRASERQLEANVSLAKLVAERLLSAELSLKPERVLDIARTAMNEARGAKRVRLFAHPDDAAILGAHLAELKLTPEAAEVLEDTSLTRGNLRIETDLGVLDAALTPQLERLVAKLKESLQP